MSKTDSFVDQHKQILELVGQLNALLDETKLKNDPTPAVMLLANLTGRIKVHLSVEDKVLYPTIAKSPDEKAKAIATKYMNEMGKITEVYLAYADKWKVNNIKENPKDFITETKNVFKVLGERIQKEEKELYPLAG